MGVASAAVGAGQVGVFLTGFTAGLAFTFALAGVLAGDFVETDLGLALAAAGLVLATGALLVAGAFFTGAFGFLAATFLAAVGAFLAATGFAGFDFSTGLVAFP